MGRWSLDDDDEPIRKRWPIVLPTKPTQKDRTEQAIRNESARREQEAEARRKGAA